MIDFFYETEKIPSVNKVYKRNISGEVFKIPEVKSFQRDLATYAFCKTRNAENSFLFTKKIQVELDFFVNNSSRDIDNMAKAVLDSLQGVCFKNDAQIYKLTMRKFKSADSLERVRVKIDVFDEFEK